MKGKKRLVFWIKGKKDPQIILVPDEVKHIDFIIPVEKKKAKKK